VHSTITRCGSIAELRGMILKARCRADDVVERERAVTAAENWLLAEIKKSELTQWRMSGKGHLGKPLAPERLAA